MKETSQITGQWRGAPAMSIVSFILSWRKKHLSRSEGRRPSVSSISNTQSSHMFIAKTWKSFCGIWGIYFTFLQIFQGGGVAGKVAYFRLSFTCQIIYSMLEDVLPASERSPLSCIVSYLTFPFLSLFPGVGVKNVFCWLKGGGGSSLIGLTEWFLTHFAYFFSFTKW